MSAAIRAGRAFVELFLKDAQLRAGLNAVKVKLQSFAAAATKIGSSMAFTGAAMLGPLSLAGEDPLANNDAAETARKMAMADAAKKKAEAEGEDKIKAGKDAAEELAKIEDDRRRESLAKLDKDIEDARRRGDERKKLATDVLEGSRVRSMENGGDNMAALDEWMGRTTQIDADTEADIAEIKRKAAEEEAARVAEATRAQTDQIAMKELELKFAAKAGETEAQATAREHAKRLELIELERQQALAGIKEGEDAALINRGFDLDKMLAEASINAGTLGAAEKQVNAAGSFNASIIGRIGQDSLDKQQVTELQKQTRLLEKIEKKEGGIEFGPNW